MSSRPWTDTPLAGRAAVVTGAARGIGAAIATRLAHCGARVVIADIDADTARQAAGGLPGDGHAGVAVDVGDPKSVEALRDAALAAVGRVDVLVNNAGVISVSPVADLAWEEWERVMRVNAGGTFLCSKAFASHMAEAGGGAIVNIASIAGKRGDPTLAHYSASKFAVVGFTQALAQELAASGVTVNAVCPGTVETPMLRALAGQWGASVQEVAERFQSQPRPQSGEEIADAVVFLASMPAMTGQAINVDGGSVFN